MSENIEQRRADVANMRRIASNLANVTNRRVMGDAIAPNGTGAVVSPKGNRSVVRGRRDVTAPLILPNRVRIAVGLTEADNRDRAMRARRGFMRTMNADARKRIESAEGFAGKGIGPDRREGFKARALGSQDATGHAMVIPFANPRPVKTVGIAEQLTRVLLLPREVAGELREPIDVMDALNGIMRGAVSRLCNKRRPMVSVTEMLDGCLIGDLGSDLFVDSADVLARLLADGDTMAGDRVFRHDSKRVSFDADNSVVFHLTRLERCRNVAGDCDYCATKDPRDKTRIDDCVSAADVTREFDVMGIVWVCAGRIAERALSGMPTAMLDVENEREHDRTVSLYVSTTLTYGPIVARTLDAAVAVAYERDVPLTSANGSRLSQSGGDILAALRGYAMSPKGRENVLKRLRADAAEHAAQ